jgi:DNA-binding NarL/FixJ family response regulator
MPEDSSRKQPSPRQEEVLDLVVNGMSNKEIGARLRITERSVKHHVSQLLRVYGVASRAELIATVLGRRT